MGWRSYGTDTIPRAPLPAPRETLLFWTLLALHLLPIWIFPFIPHPGRPGPSGRGIHPAPVRPARGRAPAAVLPAQPGGAAELVHLLPDGRVLGFVSVPMAEKILLTAYVLLLPLAARYACGNRTPAGSSPCSRFPFLQLHVQHGVLQLLLQPHRLFLSPIRYWLRERGEDGTRRTVLLALLPPLGLLARRDPGDDRRGPARPRRLAHAPRSPRRARSASRARSGLARIPALAARSRARLPAAADPDRLPSSSPGPARRSRCCRCR